MASLRYFDGIRYGSFKDLEVLVDPEDNSLWLSSPSVARLLGWHPDRVREKLTSKSLKSFTGKALASAKKVKAKSYVSTTAANGRFYVRHDGAKWHLWFPSMGDSVIAVENCAMLGVTY